MRVFLIIALLLLLPDNSNAQHCDMTRTTEFLADPESTDCDFEYTDGFVPIPCYDSIIKKVIVAAGLELGNVRIAHVRNIVNNFFTGIADDNPAFPAVFFNITYVDRLYRHCGANDGTLTTLAAHEIGHLLMYHSICGSKCNDKDSAINRAKELQADYYAGYMAYKLGVTICDALSICYIINGIDETETHPSRTNRINALKAGYILAMKHAGNNDYERWPPFDDRPHIVASAVVPDVMYGIAPADSPATVVSPEEISIENKSQQQVKHQYKKQQQQQALEQQKLLQQYRNMQLDELSVVSHTAVSPDTIYYLGHDAGNVVIHNGRPQVRYSTEEITITPAKKEGYVTEIQIVNTAKMPGDRRQKYLVDSKGIVWKKEKKNKQVKTGSEVTLPAPIEN